MSNYLLDERNRIKKLINSKLAFNKKVVLNAVTDLDDVSPTQKLAIMERVTNKNLIPKTSIIQELQKQQILEDTSKPFIKALDARDNAKLKHAKSQELALQDNSRDKQIQLITANIDTLLTHSFAKQTNKSLISLLENVGKIYQTLFDYNLYQHLSQNELAKLYAINKIILNKKFFKNKDNINKLPLVLGDLYNFMHNNIKTAPDSLKELSDTILIEYKKPIIDNSGYSLEEINDKINSPKQLSKTTIDNILKSLINKYNNLTYDNEEYLYDLYLVSDNF